MDLSFRKHSDTHRCLLSRCYRGPAVSSNNRTVQLCAGVSPCRRWLCLITQNFHNVFISCVGGLLCRRWLWLTNQNFHNTFINCVGGLLCRRCSGDLWTESHFICPRSTTKSRRSTKIFRFLTRYENYSFVKCRCYRMHSVDCRQHLPLPGFIKSNELKDSLRPVK